MDVTSPTHLRQLLKRHGLVPLKQLGQSFLVDGNIVNKIVQLAAIETEDLCLEIGPGAGALSVALCQKARRLVAIEIDKGMTELLAEVLYPYPNVTIIHQDALKYDFKQITESWLRKIKVVANLPYYITSPLILKLLRMGEAVESMTLMMQREVAQRIAAKPGSSEYGALSVLVQNRCNIIHGFKVPPECFYPRPKVESSVLRFDMLSAPQSGVEDQLFTMVVYTAFTQKRKTLLNNFHAKTGQSKTAIRTAIIKAGLDASGRAEELDVEQFGRLAQTVGPLLCQNPSFNTLSDE